MSTETDEHEITWYRQASRASRDAPGVRELRREVDQLRSANARGGSGRRPPRAAARTGVSRGSRGPGDHRRAGRTPAGSQSRRRLTVLLGVLVIVVVAVLLARPGHRSFALPSRSALAGLGAGQRIVAIADSQVGYSTDPSRSYCNKFSAYWNTGGSACPAGSRAEEWCADFAAWAWRHAGVRFTYGYDPGDLNASAASFYEWAVARGRWHPATSGFRATPGDVAVYGLSLSGSPTAAHVAIVTGDPVPGRGPEVINGDGDRTGYSMVETGAHELRAVTGRGGGAPLIGYASPT